MTGVAACHIRTRGCASDTGGTTVRVLVATATTQGLDPDDHADALEGELVHLPVLGCPTPSACRCLRAFAGVASQRSTTTAEVAERELSTEDVLAAVTDAVIAAGWVDVADAGAAGYQEAELLAWEVTGELLELAARLPLGSIVARRGPRLLVRSIGGVAHTG